MGSSTIEGRYSYYSEEWYYGSHYDPFIVNVIVLLVVGGVLLIWEPKMLARLRFGSRSANDPPRQHVLPAFLVMHSQPVHCAGCFPPVI